MTYIDYLNDFNQWLETNALPVSSQLMYFRLLNIFNRAGWPEDVGVDNLRLQLMVDAKTEKTAIRARDKLVETGFITYRKGKKSSPNRYALTKNTVKDDCVYDSVRDSISDSICDSTNDSHIKTKNKTKTKNIPPLPPTPDFGPELSSAFADWQAYKAEKRQGYKPTGLRSLTAQVKKHAAHYGEAAVAELLRECMASNWQGVAWDKLERRKDAPPQSPPPDPDDWKEWSV